MSDSDQDSAVRVAEAMIAAANLAHGSPVSDSHRECVEDAIREWTISLMTMEGGDSLYEQLDWVYRTHLYLKERGYMFV